MISFAFTERQFLDGSKTVTRRNGWASLQVGDQLMAVRKAMGLKKGEKVHKLGMIQVTGVRLERLNALTQKECRLEGFPDMLPREFVDFFCRTHKGVTPTTMITRIEFVRLELK